ncbi:Uncharacterized protein dnm_022960 [Desulfonema magnum]|uniref:Uncharacterized protein n=1 Tax=Desulfonema magnum TaxID=45655 RepID=A0A975BJI4_9BACT|nr:Uncharacterized protein dnm_022960 [Desulfonema magnum]
MKPLLPSERIAISITGPNPSYSAVHLSDRRNKVSGSSENLLSLLRN